MKSFLQSKQWANFQQSFGRRTFWVENKLVVKYDLPLGKSWLYSPRPEFTAESTFKKFLKDLEKLAQKENAIFTKIELASHAEFISASRDSVSELHSVRNDNISIYQYGNITMKLCGCLQPQDTLLLDLSQSEKEIMENMHSKTRYNIHLAEKHKVQIKKSSDPADIDIFYNLALKTSKRDGFRYHSRDYYKKMLEVLIDKGNDLKVELFIAYKKSENSKSVTDRHAEFNSASRDSVSELHSVRNDKSNKLTEANEVYPVVNPQDSTVGAKKLIPLAAILVAFYRDMAIYLHGASDHQYRKYMAPYLLQWIAIKEAKKRKCKTYDFWGISPIRQIPNNKLQITNNDQNSPHKADPLHAENVQNPKQYNNLTIEQFNNNHEWAGITRFKLGFDPNGKVVHYPDCFDVVCQPIWYLIYNTLKKFK